MRKLLNKYIYNQDASLKGLNAKRVTILNFCCLLVVFDILFFTTKRFYENTLNFDILSSYLTYLLFFIIVYTLQRQKHYLFARILFMISFGVAVYSLTHFLFVYENTEYNYLALPILALFFFDKKWVHYTVLIISVFLFFIPYYITHKRNIESFVPEEKIFLFVILFLVVKFFKDVNESNENKLKKAYAELEEKKQSELAHLQLKSLKAQMNPHFMFNAMNSIQNLVLKGDKQKAYDYLTKFASLIRENLNMSEKSFVSFESELLLLKKYLELEKLRFKDNFKYKIIEYPEMLEIKIPSMIIQPYVENAIKHGLLHKKEGKRKLTIEFIKEEKVLLCKIVDNGIGIENSKRLQKLNNIKRKSFSTKSIEERLLLLRDYYKTDIGVEYPEVSTGTTVLIKIPYF